MNQRCDYTIEEPSVPVTHTQGKITFAVDLNPILIDQTKYNVQVVVNLAKLTADVKLAVARHAPTPTVA
jgi:hypothetical protein